MDTTVGIKGMSCKHCVMAVTKALKEIDGITDARVDLDKAQATIEHDTPLDMARLKEHIEKAGYELG